MAIILTNAMIVDLDPPNVESGALRIDGPAIAERGASVAPAAGDDVVDCGGAVVLPGLVNGHTHLYSALAVGLPPPPRAPRDFREILELVWWRLDRALDDESIEVSARIGAIEAVCCGTTTLIDHHASPNCIDGSLDRIERGLADVGVRGLLCYETTDRHGRGGREAGLAENRRYLERCRHRAVGRFAGLVGAHASFTLEDESLERLSALAREFDTGVHIHVAEDPCDENDCRQRCGVPLIERLERHGIATDRSVFAHGTHLNAAAIARVNELGVTMAHNARSNMHNAVGYAPVAHFACPVMLGTDGIGADMPAEARAAWFVSRHARGGLSPVRILAMLAESARRASRLLGITLGRLEAGATADVVVTDYVPCSPLDSSNLVGHMLFGLTARHVRDVLVGGRWIVRERRLLTCDERAQRESAVGVARALWERMSAL